MKQILRKQTKRELALWMAILILFSAIPYSSIGVSYAADETVIPNASVTDGNSASDGDLSNPDNSIKTFIISWSTVNEGSVSAGDACGAEGEIEVESGKEVKLEFLPKAGYQVTKVSVNESEVLISDCAISENGYYEYLIASVTGDKEVRVCFEKIKTVWKKVTPEDLGITLVNHKGRVLTLDEDNKCYGQRISVSNGDGYIYRLSEEDAYTPVIELDESTQISSIFVRENTPAEFGTEKKYNLKNSVEIVIDTTLPTMELIGETNIWLDGTTDQIELSGKVEDANPDYVVWSETELDEEGILECTNRTDEFENGIFTFSEIDVSPDKDAEVFYLYAVDKAENCSEATCVHVYRDGVAAVITDIAIVSEAEVNKLPYGTFTNQPLELKITAKDVEKEGEQHYYTSGVQNVEIYAGNNEKPIHTEEISAPICSTEEIPIDVTIPYVEEMGFLALSEMRIRVIDAMGNVSPDYRLDDFIDGISKLVMIEQHAPQPELTVVAKTGTEYQKIEGENIQYWYSEIPEISYRVNDMQNSRNGSGLSERTVTLNGTTIDDYTKNDYQTVDTYTAVPQSEEGNIDVEKLSDMVQGENNLQISFQDIAGNLGQDNVKIYLDVQEPVIAGFSICIQEENAQTQSGNRYAFGNFYNNVVEVTVHATDNLNASGEEIPSAGLQSITLYLDGKPYQTTEDIIDGKATFILPEEQVLDEEQVYLDTKIFASAKDMVNNTSEAVDMTEVNNGLENSALMVETVKPGLTMSPVGNYYKYDEETLYAKEDVSFTIKVSDEHSGLHSVKVYANGELLEDKAYSDDATERCTTDSLTVNTGDANINTQNLYEMQVVVTDNAGNQNTDTIKVYQDLVAPQITVFEMQADGRTQISGETIAAAEMPYGYYFRENVTVIIRATDGTQAADCGVKEIQYYTIRNDGLREELRSTAVNAEGYATIEIPAGFKGQLYACAYDHLMNAGDTFVSPEGIIVEPYELHEKENHISFGKASTSQTDNLGLELYASSVPVVITVTDTISGIQDVEWSVTAPYDTEKNETGHIQIDNGGDFSSGNGGWKVSGEDKNLVTELKKTIVVSHNSNDITLYVKMTDRAGNVTYSNCKFSIDTTNPVIELAFDNMTPDSEYTNVYDNERTATITVRERNFVGRDMLTEITNEDGPIPVLSEWSTSTNETNPDETVSTAKITFSDDGEYTMSISGKDGAGNSANTISVEEFIIDRTMPVIAVTYDNNDVRNNSYYAEERTATIRITEHNFASERVSIAGTATNEGEEGVFPAISGWSHNGDEYTTTIACDKDGFYHFEVEYSDKAGNVGEKFSSDYYYVDLTAPVIEINGVEAFSANNGEVIPVISLSDSNYDYKGAHIALTGANRGKVEPEGEYALQEDGQTYTFVDFPKEKAYDDVYTLNVTLKDLAGNETTEMITFSVNRFGSVYIFDESLKQIAGTYVREEIDVKLTEVNIDSLEHDTIKVAVDFNGNIRDLVEGEDYMVRQTGGEGDWYRYEYVIDSSIFAGDGRYIVTLYSEDKAGNINQNIAEDKKAEISFGVDKTAPVIIPIDIESDEQYLVNGKSATVAVNDNLILENVEIYIGAEKCNYEVNGENYTFIIPEADEKQSVTVVAKDLAGNRADVVVSDILVTTNRFVSWINNTPLFLGSIAGMVVAVGGVISIIVLLRRRRNEKA